jgi:transitional endoplasmic reticulum ATPase
LYTHKDINIDEIVSKSKDYSGADIEMHCKAAAFLAMGEGGVLKARKVKMKHFEQARSKIHPSCTKEIRESYENFEAKIHARKKNKLTLYS